METHAPCHGPLARAEGPSETSRSPKVIVPLALAGILLRGPTIKTALKSPRRGKGLLRLGLSP